MINWIEKVFAFSNNYQKHIDPILTIPGSWATSMLAYAGQLFTDLNTLIIVAIGLPVGFWVVAKAIALVRGAFRSRSV